MRWGKRDSEAIVYIYESEYQAIILEVQRFRDIETGGDMFGTFTHGDMPVVWLALGPGPNAQRNRTEFQQDPKYTTEWQQHLMQSFGIQYIGTWHSHHQLGINHPSSGDVQAAQGYARRHGRQKTIEIIAVYKERDVVLRPYFYPDAQAEGYVEASFKILSGESPIRQRLASARRSSPEWQQPPRIHEQPHDRDARTPQEEAHRGTAGDLPPILQRELMNLDVENISVEQKKSDVFLVVMPLGYDQLLATAVQGLTDLRILQVNLIDPGQNLNLNITPQLLERGAIKSSPQDDGKALRNILISVQRGGAIVRRKDDGTVDRGSKS